IVIERRPPFNCVVEAQPRELSDFAKVSKVECPNILACHRIAIELLVARINVILAGQPVVGKKVSARRVLARMKSWRKLRFASKQRRRRVTGDKFAAEAEAAKRILKIQPDDMLIVIAGDALGKKLFNPLQRDADG